jgi:hypothetical protein
MQFKITHKKLTLALFSFLISTLIDSSHLPKLSMKSLPIDITSNYSTVLIRFITPVDENLRNFF